MLYLLYPLKGEVEGYPKDQFIADLISECEKDIRKCFDAGAKRVSIDFTEGRLASRNDPSNPWTGAQLLQEFVDINNKVLDRFSAEERVNIGIHTCPGGDCDSTHSADVDYHELLPSMFQMVCRYFHTIRTESVLMLTGDVRMLAISLSSVPANRIRPKYIRRSDKSFAKTRKESSRWLSLVSSIHRSV